ncbi:unnamed protein product (macronuclear) [Paramecium tetraurelia]|uniref:Uncharacterized protein n=1 Tax=Paramecium tetraurelia TaxID=5888 RepID=A0BCJ8_PARTE|nr:uncharacterized protein GSPATT00004359001 [Paramecium tetraurelia]CAK56265.1 unnamed protein product [Paramecium tetraurelia]|eukprot:XP_001423663.1 hypothetical protein (macronuclear) [Paramecium tetraurelia strain d4-2]
MQSQQERKSLVLELLKSIDQQNHSLTVNNQPLHEFQWFELDNKIRILVHELLEPHLKEFVEQRSDYQTVSLKLDKYIQNYEEFKALYFQNGKGTPIIQQLRQQMLELQEKFENIQQTSLFTINENNRKLDQIQFLRDQQYHQLKMIENNQMQWTEQIEKYRQQNQDFKQVLLDNLEQVKKDNQIAIVTVYDKLQSMNLYLDKQDCVQKDLKVKIDSNYDILQSYQDKLLLQIAQSQQNQQSLELLNKRFPKLDELLSYDRSVKNDLGLMNNKLQYFENYIEKYFPLFLQGTLSDTLHNCLSENDRFKLAQFEEMKFTELHRVIVSDDGVPNLDRKINEYTSFIEKQLKKNMSFLRDQKVSSNQVNTPIQEDISSKISEIPITPKSDDSSERVGVKDGTNLKIDRNQMEFYLQNKFNEFKLALEKDVSFLQNTADYLDKQFNVLHDQMIKSFELIKIQNYESVNQITQQMTDLINQFNNIPLLTTELNEVQQQQQQSIQKLLQCQILMIQQNQEEVQYNGQVYSQEQCKEMLNDLIYQMRNENDNSNIFDSPIKKLKPQLVLDDRKSIRIKTSSQSGLRKSIYSQSQTRSTTEKRKLYLLGSKIQQDLCQSLNNSVLNPRKTNTKLLFQSKANQIE